MDRTAVQRIKSRLDFVELAQRYLELRPNGERWSGPCPFHQETKPSFHVNPGQGFYYCFGCQASGDVIDFYARINGLDFKQALVQLARETGVELDFGPVNPQERQELEQRDAALRMAALATEHFRHNLISPAGALARDYLLRRGVSPEMLEAFQVGWSRADWHGLEEFLQSQGFTRDQAVDCGLLVRNDRGKVYDRFRGRIMFPIHDLTGRVIAFGGRAIDSEEPKYINSSESSIYTKGQHLYGLHQARKAIVRDKRALLTEGYLDVIALHQFGFSGAVGVLGTALTPEQVKRLGGFCSRIDLLFDGDQAGQKAALRAAEMFLAQGLACHVVTMPQGEDVDSLLHAQGPETLRAVLDTGRDGLDFCVRTVSETYAPREIMGWVRRFLDNVAADDLRGFYLPRLAAGLGMSETELRKWRPTAPKQTAALAHAAPQTARAPTNQPGGPRLTARDRQLLAFAVSCPEYRHELAASGLDAVLEDSWAKAIWDKLRILDASVVAHDAREDASGYDYSVLEEPERRLCYQLLAEAPQRDQADRAAFWAEVREFLTKNQFKKRQQEMLQALRAAQAQGDQQRVSALLQAYQDLAMEA
ncbi:DNA primase [Desulfonatronum sp. SC1]|uniref:DNA primase n=1 Tax=Desulfonatronum sp. SC1 TaxID=2109626 RepID=UPI000D3274F9|nr:DNA primase [Desulfonatronum sp. SC1]PTN37701.1 DNA primase [Desulfonatronum sp. SC1]